MNQLQFFRALVILNGAVPLAMLGWDTYRGQLGANAVNNALHITGLLSLIFLFLALLVSPLNWLTKWGGWIASRRALGLYGFFYAVVHLLIYVVFDRALSLSSTLNEIWMRRFLQVGLLALLLMVPLAVTSTNSMIQWMGPKSWKLLHRSVYLAVILGVVHYYMLVKSDVRQPLAFAAVLAALLVARLVHHYLSLRKEVASLRQKTVAPTSAPTTRNPAPASRPSPKPSQNWKGELRIGAIFQETPDVKTFRLVAADGGPFPFDYRAGQFINLQLTIAGKRVNRSYTLASAPRGQACELSIKREPDGLASRFIHDQLKVGDVLKVSGPSGKFAFDERGAKAVLLIAGGVGITPVMSIARSLTDRAWPGEIHFLIVAKTEQDLIFRDELMWLADRWPNLHVRATLTRCEPNSVWSGDRGRITASLLNEFAPNLREMPVLLCGPNEMMDATVELLSQMGVPQSRITTEAFAAKKARSDSAGPASMATANTNDNTSRVGVADDDSSGVLAGETAIATITATSVRFAKRDVETQVSPETTILEAAEEASIALPYECRSGFCGQCKTRLLAGKVAMDCEDALTSKEKSTGWILACQARPSTDVTIDA